MIHNLNILHPQYFLALLHDFGRISPTTRVYLDEISVIAIEPLPFAPVDLHNFHINIVYLLLQLLYSVAITALVVDLLLRWLLLVLFHLFYLVVDAGRLMEEGLVDQDIDLLLNDLLGF